MLKYEKEYNRLCTRILEEGYPIYNERTGKTCHTIINHDFVYDVGKGEVPLLTNKQCFTVSAVAEILGYLRQYTDAQDFSDIGSPTWFANASNPVWQDNPNCRSNTDMGEAYRFGKQGYFVEVTPAIYPTSVINKVEMQVKDVHYETLQNTEDYIGKEFESSTSGTYRVTDYIGESSDKRIKFFQIKFKDTGTEMTIQKSQIRNGNIKDYQKVSVYGVGTVGCVVAKEDKWLYKAWTHMLERCYSEKSKHYPNYGGRGVFVHQDWLNFQRFKEDVKGLENYYLAKVFPKEYTLDKDFFKSNCYAKHTCKWASKKEQAVNTRNVKTYYVEGIYVKGLEFLAQHLNISKNEAFGKVKRGEVELASKDVNISYCEVDPVKEVYCKLLEGVDDRRLIATAWLPHLQQKSCLVPCAFEHIWSLVDNKLSLTVTQRSGDIPLGIPFNSFSFCFLLKLMAKITGNEPDKVYHKIINAHVYDDQVEPLQKQLSRTPLDIQPTLEISDWVNTLEDVVGNNKHAREYFTLTGYEHQGKISFPFST